MISDLLIIRCSSANTNDFITKNSCERIVKATNMCVTCQTRQTQAHRAALFALADILFCCLLVRCSTNPPSKLNFLRRELLARGSDLLVL
jgi:hypothetical protein